MTQNGKEIKAGPQTRTAIPITPEFVGRWVEAEESDALLAPYGEWAGLASVYLLAGFSRGLVPVADAAAA